MNDELAAIRERARQWDVDDDWPTEDSISPIRDRRTLLALLDTEREARASAEASVAALREALEMIATETRRRDVCPTPGNCMYPQLHDDESPGEFVDRLRGIARALLADTRAAAEAHDAAIRREAVDATVDELYALGVDVDEAVAVVRSRASVEPSDA